jgi:hypothetical protein
VDNDSLGTPHAVQPQVAKYDEGSVSHQPNTTRSSEEVLTTTGEDLYIRIQASISSLLLRNWKMPPCQK